MIAAGVSAKALSTYMGHATISITLDRYGHLMPASEDQAAGLLDAYLEQIAHELHRVIERFRVPAGGVVRAYTGCLRVRDEDQAIGLHERGRRRVRGDR